MFSRPYSAVVTCNVIDENTNNNNNNKNNMFISYNLQQTVQFVCLRTLRSASYRTYCYCHFVTTADANRPVCIHCTALDVYVHAVTATGTWSAVSSQRSTAICLLSLYVWCTPLFHLTFYTLFAYKLELAMLQKTCSGFDVIAGDGIGR